MMTNLKLFFLISIISVGHSQTTDICFWNGEYSPLISENYTCSNSFPPGIISEVKTQITILGNDSARYYFDSVNFAYDLKPPTVPARGSIVKVAAIPIGSGGRTPPQQLELADYYLTLAGDSGADIVLLPEYFSSSNKIYAETIPGPSTILATVKAAKYNMYIVCPVLEKSEEENQTLYYSTSVVISRTGEILGKYRKIFPFFGEAIPSLEGVKVFDLDFGRIGILTCFDINFPEVWQQASALGVDILFWPSAYSGGTPLNAYAILYQYYIVSAGTGWVIDITGTLTNTTQIGQFLFLQEIDLDRSFVHKDFNGDKLKKLLAEHVGEIEIEHDFQYSNWWLLRSKNPEISVRSLLKKYKIENVKEYRARSRLAVNIARTTGTYAHYIAPEGGVKKAGILPPIKPITGVKRFSISVADV